MEVVVVVEVVEVVDVVVVVVVSGKTASNRSCMRSNSPKISCNEIKFPRLDTGHTSCASANWGTGLCPRH